ncbi:MAG: PAS domain S-box protein [Opitutaceae bacterium]|nr:PAS domain S-box protein [Opitutaceae bacterium]
MQQFLANSRDGIAILDPKSGCQIVQVNLAFERLTHLQQSEAVGKFLHALLPSEQWDALKESLHCSQLFRGIVKVCRDNTRVVHLDATAFPMLGAENDRDLWMVALRDASEAVERDHALQLSEEHHRLLAEAIRDLVVVHRPQDGHCLYASPASRTILGYEPQEMAARSLHDLIHPESLSLARKVFDGHVNGRPETTFIHQMHRKDGRAVWVETTSQTRFSSEGVPEIVSTIRDISRRKAAEASLTAMHGLLSAVYEAVPLGLCLLDSRNQVQLCNRAFSIHFAAEPADLAGRPIAPVIPLSNIESATVRPGSLQTFDLNRPDGGCFPAEISVTNVRFTEETWRLLTLSDLSERRRIDARLREAGKLESLATLAGGVAHDFNNLLTIILGYAGLLGDAADDPGTLQRATRAIIDAGRRGADVVHQLQLFASQHDAEIVPTDLQALIEDTVDRTCTNWTSQVHVSCTFNHTHSTVPIDPTQVALGLRQLLQNACDALPQGGTISIRTSESPAGSLPTGEHPEAIWVTIEDNGSGMDDSTRARIFEPFFAKDRGSSVRGLGLAVVYGIMRAHRGTIEVDSKPGLGTRVHLAFPRSVPAGAHDSHSTTAQVEGRQAQPPEKYVLVVEDEAEIGHLWEKIFRSEAIPMFWARDAEEALRLFSEHHHEIGLLFSDIGLPGMNGWQLAQRIREEHPGIPVILASGAFKPGDRSLADLDEPVVCLPKPFPPSEIVSRIRTLLPTGRQPRHIPGFPDPHEAD